MPLHRQHCGILLDFTSQLLHNFFPLSCLTFCHRYLLKNFMPTFNRSLQRCHQGKSEALSANNANVYSHALLRIHILMNSQLRSHWKFIRDLECSILYAEIITKASNYTTHYSRNYLHRKPTARDSGTTHGENSYKDFIWKPNVWGSSIWSTSAQTRQFYKSCWMWHAWYLGCMSSAVSGFWSWLYFSVSHVWLFFRLLMSWRSL